MHFGGNPGWSAHFLIDTSRREGFVVANNSSLGYPFNVAVQKLWLNTVLGLEGGTVLPASEGLTPSIHRKAVGIVAALGVFLLALAGWCVRQIVRGKRHRAISSTRRGLLILMPPFLATLLWWYVFYAPQGIPLPLPPTFLSIWRLPLINYITALLMGWIVVALLFALFPRCPIEPANVSQNEI
jgi:hypothetical protein